MIAYELSRLTPLARSSTSGARRARTTRQRGIAALCTSGRFERFALLKPLQDSGIDSFLALLAVYFRPGCARASLLREFAVR